MVHTFLNTELTNGPLTVYGSERRRKLYEFHDLYSSSVIITALSLTVNLSRMGDMNKAEEVTVE